MLRLRKLHSRGRRGSPRRTGGDSGGEEDEKDGEDEEDEGDEVNDGV